MAYADYHARDWAGGRSNAEIEEEIKRLDDRYFKPYPWNGVENAQHTLDRAAALRAVLNERASGELGPLGGPNWNN